MISYFPSSGIASLEEIVDGAREAFNMEHDLAVAVASFGIVSPFGRTQKSGGLKHIGFLVVSGKRIH